MCGRGFDGVASVGTVAVDLIAKGVEQIRAMYPDLTEREYYPTNLSLGCKP
jgi:hypothetical protein